MRVSISTKKKRAYIIVATISKRTDTFRYEAFGLTVQSDLELPELLPAPSPRDCDVEIRAGSSPREVGGELSLFLSIQGIGDFLIDGGRQIFYYRTEGASDGDLRLFLLGSCMGALLQQRGYVVLHGNAVALDEEHCRVVVGESGAGKSTLAAWHYLHGARVLADDVCAITFDSEGRALVLPSFPQIKLWKTSTDLLGISSEGLRRLRPGVEKFALPLRERFQNGRLILKEVVEVSADLAEEKSLLGSGKVKRLIHHTYRHHFLNRMKLTAAYHRKILQLASVIEMKSAPRISLKEKTGLVEIAPERS